MKPAHLIVIFLFWALLLVGAKECEQDGEPGTCNPGSSQSCVCSEGAWGIQYCNATGRAWSRCKCDKDYQSTAVPVEDPILPGN